MPIIIKIESMGTSNEIHEISLVNRKGKTGMNNHWSCSIDAQLAWSRLNYCCGHCKR